MLYLLDERTEHAYENRRINAVTNKIHGREAIRRSSFNVGNNQDNRYMLRAEDSFSRYCRKHPIPNKEAHTVAKVLMDQPSTSMGCLNPSTNPVERFHRTLTAMLRTSGPGVQDIWDFWLNASVSNSTGVTPNYAMFGCKATLPVDLVFPTPSVEKRTMYHWTGDLMEERQRAYTSMREVQGRRVRRNAQMYKPLMQNI